MFKYTRLCFPYLLSIIFIILNLATPIFSSEKYYPEVSDPLKEPWRWQHYAYLSGKGLRAFTQDKNNNMWFAIDDGVIFYDGFAWKTYKEADGIFGNPVQTILAAHDGTIYAGSVKGLSKFNGQSWDRIWPPAEDINYEIHVIKELSDGSVAVGTNKGFLHLKKNQIVLYGTPQSIEEIQKKFDNIKTCQIPETVNMDGIINVYDILQDNEDFIWLSIGSITDEHGLIIKFLMPADSSPKLNSYTLFSQDSGFNLGTRMRFLQAPDKKIWIISADRNVGIYKVINNKWQYFLLGDITGGDDLHVSILSTKDGTIWLGGLGKLYVFRNNEWEMYKAPEVSIPPTRILLMESRNGDLWIAGQQNEVYKIDYSGRNSETFKSLNFQCETNDGDQWFLSVDDKAVLKSGSIWKSFDTKDGLMQHPVRIIATTRGQIWATGSQNSIAATAYFENGKWYKQIHPKLSWGIDYRAIIESSDGSIWFGAGVDINEDQGQVAGVLRLLNPLSDHKKWVHYTREHGIEQQNAYGIAESPDGKIWIGGTSLVGFDGDKWFKQTEPPQLKERVDDVHSRKQSDLWVGSRFYGIFRYDGKDWSHYTVDDGLMSNTIISILAESENSVWVATDKDICRFDGKTWTTNIFPKQLTFGREGGSLLMSSDRTLWINKSPREWKRRALTNKKITHDIVENFLTVRYKPDMIPPETFVNQDYVKEVDDAGNTLIEWTGHDAWDNTSPHELTYSYRLNDSEWSPFESINLASFKNLPSGDYRFQVRARDKDFNVEPTPVNIYFKVLRPVYLRAWFITLMVAFISIIAFLTHRLIQRNINLRKTNAQLGQAKKETDDILHNVDEGLLLLNQDYLIGSQYSTILETILLQKDLAQVNLVDLLKSKITKNEVETLVQYLNVIFTENIDVETLDELNPLSEIKLNFGKYTEPKYLTFKFRRVDTNEHQNRELIVTVRDITDQVRLEQKIKASEEESQRQMNWLLSILHVEPQLLQDFINTVQQEINNITELLETGRRKSVDNYNEILIKVHQSMHLVKGNASLLALKFFADQAHKFEDKISELQKHNNINEDDLVELNSELEKIKTMINEVIKLLDKIGQIHNQMRPKREFENKLLIQSLNNLILSSAEETGKKIKLDIEKFKGVDIPHQYKLLLKEILIQLVRNSIAHGIESPEERRKNNKSEEGTISISTVKKDDYVTIIIRDDGRGLNLDKVKQAAQKSGKWSEEEIAKWDRQQLIEAIYVSGISTMEKTGMIAGRGVGLDAVKERINKYNGRIGIDFKEGKYCQFEVSLNLN
jgi:ligand-binding sensor domain-containing protein/HPt (histidine-containing phosphotransfer) domain-containing protein